MATDYSGSPRSKKDDEDFKKEVFEVLKNLMSREKKFTDSEKDKIDNYTKMSWKELNDLRASMASTIKNKSYAPHNPPNIDLEDLKKSVNEKLNQQQYPNLYQSVFQNVYTTGGGYPSSGSYSQPQHLRVDDVTKENLHIYGVVQQVTLDRDFSGREQMTVVLDFQNRNARIGGCGFGRYAYVTFSNTSIDQVNMPVTDGSDIIIEVYDMKKIALMQDSEKDWFKLYNPYHKDAIQAIKDKIPITMRQPIYSDMVYQRTGKRMFECWRIHKTFLNEAVEIINRFWPGQAVDSDLVEAVGDGKTDWIEKVFDACPKDNLPRLYKALASVYHPDVGGDSPTMSRINVEYHRRTENGKQPNTGKP